MPYCSRILGQAVTAHHDNWFAIKLHVSWLRHKVADVSGKTANEKILYRHRHDLIGWPQHPQLAASLPRPRANLNVTILRGECIADA